MQLSDFMFFVALICAFIFPYLLIKCIKEKDVSDNLMFSTCVSFGAIVFTILMYVK